MNQAGSQNDAELVRDWRRGNLAAFEALVRRWQQPMARFLTRLVDCPQLAQDLCQEVFLRVYLAGAGYRETGAFSNWLYRIALNAARDAARRRRPTLPLSGPDPENRDSSAALLYEQNELAETVRQALADLSPPLREVLVLRHYQDMNFEEMARLLLVPSSTLKSRFATAINQLRTRLSHLGWSHEEAR